MTDTLFHIALYLFLWSILSELIDIKNCLKRKDDDTNDN